MRPTLVYLLATSYSGSTLLTYLLAQHSKISTIGELKAPSMGDIDVYQCACGKLIRTCEFWQAVTEDCKQNNVDFSVDDFNTVLDAPGTLATRILKARVRTPTFEAIRQAAIRLYPGLKRQLDTQLRRNFAVSQAVCRCADGPVFVDGSKDSTRLMHFINSGLWDVRVVYMKRDGRAVMNSFKKHRKTDAAAATERWVGTTRELQRMRARLPQEVVLDLKYEDMCAAPQQEITRIWEWLGLESEPLNEKDFKSGDFHLLGNAMRLTSVGEIRTDTSWQDKLSASELAHFEQHAGALNRQLGYGLES